MILEDIVESTKERVETNKKRHSIYELKEFNDFCVRNIQPHDRQPDA